MRNALGMYVRDYVIGTNERVVYRHMGYQDQDKTNYIRKTADGHFTVGYDWVR